MATATQPNRAAVVRISVMGAAIHLSAWLGAGFTFGAIFSSSTAWLAYGLLSGWWAALYFGYLFSIGWNAIPPSVALYALVAVVDGYYDLGLFHDSAFVFPFLGFIVYISPIPLNAIVRVAWRLHRDSRSNLDK